MTDRETMEANNTSLRDAFEAKVNDGDLGRVLEEIHTFLPDDITSLTSALFMQALTIAACVNKTQSGNEKDEYCYWDSNIDITNARIINILLDAQGYHWRISRLFYVLEMEDGSYSARATLSPLSLYNLVKGVSSVMDDKDKEIFDSLVSLFAKWEQRVNAYPGS